MPRRRSSDSVSTSLLTVLENEIKELETSLEKPVASKVEQAFLDECAG